LRQAASSAIIRQVASQILSFLALKLVIRMIKKDGQMPIFFLLNSLRYRVDAAAMKAAAIDILWRDSFAVVGTD
jgi:hypothetical protein